LRALERRLSRREAPILARRAALRACAAIGSGCREALRGSAAADPTRAAIVRLGERAAALLGEIPDAPLPGAPHPAGDEMPGGVPGGVLVRQMQVLIERWRRERQIDRLAAELALARAYARRARRETAAAAPAGGNPC
jgi:hypothetical protein